MTIHEAIYGYPGLGGISSELMNKVSIDRGINPADDYDISYSASVNLAVADLLVAVVNSPDYTENKLSERYPRKEMLNTAMQLYRMNGEPEKADELSKSKFRIIGRAPKKW